MRSPQMRMNILEIGLIFCYLLRLTSLYTFSLNSIVFRGAAVNCFCYRPVLFKSSSNKFLTEFSRAEMLEVTSFLLKKDPV